MTQSKLDPLSEEQRTSGQVIDRRKILALCLFGFFIVVGASLFFAMPGRLIPFSGKPADRLELLTMLRNQEYQALEEQLAGYQQRFESGSTTDLPVDFAFHAFASADPELETWLDKWARIYPDSWAAILARGVYYLHLAETVRGERFGRTSVAPHKKLVDDHLALAMADGATATVRNSRLSVAYAVVIRVATFQENDAKARQFLEQGLSATPESRAIAVRYLEHLRYRSEKPSAEIAEFLQGYRNALPAGAIPGSLDGYLRFLAAEKLMRKGRHREAVRDFDAALQHGEGPFYRYFRAENFYQAGLLDRALQDLDRLVVAWPHVPEFLSARARYKAALGQDEGALADWQAALELDPLQPRILDARAAFLTKQDRREDALQDRQDSIIYGSFDYELRYQLGRLQVELQDFGPGVQNLWHASYMAPPWEVNYRFALAEARATLPIPKQEKCDAEIDFRIYIAQCERHGHCRQERIDRAEAYIEEHSKPENRC